MSPCKREAQKHRRRERRSAPGWQVAAQEARWPVSDGLDWLASARCAAQAALGARRGGDAAEGIFLIAVRTNTS